ncbi:syntaxin-binding protein [Vairimorpha necatrix]|uniref:Syntaxin-binding protein n=1 Tax=Vairimorpha necatrix TaxID=6039 RepID=A0AAX4JCQ7_9MICR
MDIKKTFKQKIISDVLTYNTDWPVLIYDKTCAELLKNLFTKSEFITYNIVMSQFIEENRDQADFPVIYFVKCTSEISKIINSDFINKKYSSFNVCSLCEPENLNNEISCKVVHLNIKAMEERFFLSEIDDLNSVCNILNSYFFVEYTNRNLEKYSKILTDDNNKLGKLILFDRSIDLFTPLLHFYTFQPLLEDINITDMKKIYEEYGNTTLWKDLRHTHLGEMSDLLKSYVKKVRTKPNENIKDLMKAVMDAPETMKTNKGLRLFFDLTEECYAKFDYFDTFANIEQSIVTKEKIKNEKILKILKNQNIEENDRKRIFLLYKLSGHKYTDEEMKDLEFLKDLDIEIGDFKPISYDYKFNYAVSKFEPTISVALREYIKNNKKIIPFYKVEREKKTVQSLRKTNLISVKKEIKGDNIWCIYIKGGVTYEEIKCIYKLSDELGIEFVIGSDKIVRAQDYINK